jgi:hypothetical protein
MDPLLKSSRWPSGLRRFSNGEDAASAVRLRRYNRVWALEWAEGTVPMTGGLIADGIKIPYGWWIVKRGSDFEYLSDSTFREEWRPADL